MFSQRKTEAADRLISMLRDSRDTRIEHETAVALVQLCGSPESVLEELRFKSLTTLIAEADADFVL